MNDKDPSLAKSVERLLGAAAEFGAAIARAADKTTANGREPAAGPPNETPTGAIIRHGVSAAANLAAQIAQASQSVRGAAARSEPAGASPDASGGSGGPVLRPGATLRVPLSIENPGQEGTMEMTPAAGAWTRDGRPSEAPGSVRFTPESLSVAPRDFEKLTVTIELAEDAEAGEYRLEVALGEDAQTALAFAVVAEAPQD